MWSRPVANRARARFSPTELQSKQHNLTKKLRNCTRFYSHLCAENAQATNIIPKKVTPTFIRLTPSTIIHLSSNKRVEQSNPHNMNHDDDDDSYSSRTTNEEEENSTRDEDSSEEWEDLDDDDDDVDDKSWNDIVVAHWRQHVLAILVAILATAVTHPYIHSKISREWNPAASSQVVSPTTTQHEHFEAYQRTAHVAFCHPKSLQQPNNTRTEEQPCPI